MRKVVIWFAVCLTLAIYAKLSGIIPYNPGEGEGSVLGQSTTNRAGFGNFSTNHWNTP